MTTVEIGTGAFIAPVPNIRRGAGIGGTETATGSRTNGIDRLIVDRLGQCISRGELQAGGKALLDGRLHAVIIRISAGIEVVDSCELLVRTELEGERRLFDALGECSCGIVAKLIQRVGRGEKRCGETRRALKRHGCAPRSDR